VGSDGGVFCFGDAPDLGSLPGHPDYHAGTATEPCIGIAYWVGDGTPKAGLGYVLGTRPSGIGTLPLTYYFLGDKSLA
jgi:hypothetical protein